MNIRLLDSKEMPPMDLLELADPSQKNVAEYIKRGTCYIAESDQQIVGVYVLLPTRPDTVELINLAVKEEHQGAGIGKRLVMDAINRAKKDGYRTIVVGTGNSSLGQLALYQKCGFRMTGIDRDFFIRHYQDALFENGIQCKDMVRLSKDL